MNRDQLAKKWNQMKERVKEKWDKLTNEDIEEIQGKWDSFISKLQKRYNYSREEADREVNNWCQECEAKKGFHKRGSQNEEDQMKIQERKDPGEERRDHWKNEKKRKAG